MGELPAPLKFAIVFVLVSFAAMAIEGLYLVNLNSKPSMAVMHHHGGPLIVGAGGHAHAEEGNMHEDDPRMDASGGHAMAEGGHAPEEGHAHAALTSFGPGEGPHVHELDLAELNHVDDIAADAAAVPPSSWKRGPEVVKVLLEAREVVSELAPNITYYYWTYNGTVPGPMIRVREGDTVELTLRNHESSLHNHSIDLHAVNGPGGGSGATQVAPGEQKTFTFKALNPGAYVYHCATHNIPTHMTNGMYGLIVVEPEGGLPAVDREFYVMQGEVYTAGAIGEQGFQMFSGEKMQQEMPDYVVWNGRVNALVDRPLRARVGETVRLFVGNGGVAKISSFHVIGEIFDRVFHEAGRLVNRDVQTTLVPAGGATITDFKVNVPGAYVLVDHSLARLDKGAWGVLVVEGEAQPEIYSGAPGAGSGH